MERLSCWFSFCVHQLLFNRKSPRNGDDVIGCNLSSIIAKLQLDGVMKDQPTRRLDFDVSMVRFHRRHLTFSSPLMTVTRKNAKTFPIIVAGTASICRDVARVYRGSDERQNFQVDSSTARWRHFPSSRWGRMSRISIH